MPQKQNQPKPKFVDNPHVMESFVDSFAKMVFDGETFRMEMCVKRIDDPKPPSPPSFKQHPVVRVTMPPSAAIELFNKLNQIVGALNQAGLVRQDPVIPDSSIN